MQGVCERGSEVCENSNKIGGGGKGGGGRVMGARVDLNKELKFL